LRPRFSPGGSSLQVVLKVVLSAKASILVAAYDFTSRGIADALVSAQGKGVKVQVVADDKASTDRGALLTGWAIAQTGQTRLGNLLRADIVSW
jgi:phosphatidylserine/phosphatidylglycerophosphate/cardiolipin synthase-like enzyme